VRRVALVALSVLATATPAVAALFRWTAADGTIHYTSDPESIPEAYRPPRRHRRSRGAARPPAAAAPTGSSCRSRAARPSSSRRASMACC